MEVGKEYRRRDGLKVKIIKVDSFYMYHGDDGWRREEGGTVLGVQPDPSLDEFDLIALWETPDTHKSDFWAMFRAARPNYSSGIEVPIPKAFWDRSESVSCTCDFHSLLRNGCRCGNARSDIEAEFKRKGWR